MRQWEGLCLPPLASSPSVVLPAAGAPGARRVSGVHPLVARMGVVHFVVDWFSNALAPLIPLLITRLQLTLAGAGTLAMILQLATSVAQVLFGDLADRGRAQQMLWGGAHRRRGAASACSAFCRTWSQLVAGADRRRARRGGVPPRGRDAGPPLRHAQARATPWRST